MAISPGYDSDEPEGPRRDPYLSKRDLKIALIALPILTAIMIPIYMQQRSLAERQRCASNLKAIFDATRLYSTENNDRYAPAYATANGDLPFLDGKGRPFTWATLLQPYMVARSSFRCPSADSLENVRAQHPASEKLTLESSYGMVTALSGYPVNLVANPSRTALIAETSDRGANRTYDPAPFKDEQGRPMPDGFLVGYDTGNGRHNEKTTSVTRLAFPGTASGRFLATGQTRHEGGNLFLFSEGNVELLPPPAAYVQRQARDLVGTWATR